MSMQHDRIVEAIEYLRDVFPSRKLFDDLVAEGSHGDEVFTITGDDLAGACWALNELMEIFEVER